MLSTTTTTTTTTTNTNNNVYNLENQCHTAAPLHQQLITHWQSGHGLIDELRVDEPGHNHSDARWQALAHLAG